MTVPISKITFVNKAEIFAPKYYKDELTSLQSSGAVTMVQIPGFITDDPKPPVKIVVGINSNGDLMDDTNSLVTLPCPNYCNDPPVTRLITLNSFLKN